MIILNYWKSFVSPRAQFPFYWRNHLGGIEFAELSVPSEVLQRRSGTNRLNTGSAQREKSI